MDFDGATDQFYVLAPADFIERRNALAVLAGGEGDGQLAPRIKALRRPTVGAALINALVRERRDVIASFFSLGAELRDAQARGDGNEMRAVAAICLAISARAGRHC